MLELEYTIKRSKRKTIAIQIVNKQVVVNAPLKYPDKKINDFVLQKQKWIIKNLNHESKKPVFNYKNNEYFPFLGHKYQIKIIPFSIQEKVKIEDDVLIVYSHKNVENEKHNKNIIDKWIKQKAEEIFKQEYDKCFTLFSYKNKPVFFIKKFTARWGAYHKQFFKEHITLNINLIMYPIECLDYVIIHELSHKKHLNHSKDFYNLVEEKMPDWKKYKNILSGKID